MAQNSTGGTTEAGVGALSPRERQVILLVAEGLTTAEIGRRLCISPHTAREYIDGAVTKLGVRNRVVAAIVVARSEAASAAGSADRPATAA